MVMTDPIADMLTRIRNAVQNGAPEVAMGSSTAKVAIAEVLKREGFITQFAVTKAKPADSLKIELKYGANGEKVISSIRRMSRPGRRIYKGVGDMEPVLNNMGIAIVSTPKGILSDRECRSQNVGGEVLCTIW